MAERHLFALLDRITSGALLTSEPIADRHIGQFLVFNCPHTVPHPTVWRPTCITAQRVEGGWLFGFEIMFERAADNIHRNSFRLDQIRKFRGNQIELQTNLRAPR